MCSGGAALLPSESVSIAAALQGLDVLEIGHLLERGVSIVGGERKRVALARAF